MENENGSGKGIETWIEPGPGPASSAAPRLFSARNPRRSFSETHPRVSTLDARRRRDPTRAADRPARRTRAVPRDPARARAPDRDAAPPPAHPRPLCGARDRPQEPGEGRDGGHRASRRRPREPTTEQGGEKTNAKRRNGVPPTEKPPPPTRPPPQNRLQEKKEGGNPIERAKENKTKARTTGSACMLNGKVSSHVEEDARQSHPHALQKHSETATANVGLAVFAVRAVTPSALAFRTSNAALATNTRGLPPRRAAATSHRAGLAPRRRAHLRDRRARSAPPRPSPFREPWRLQGSLSIAPLGVLNADAFTEMRQRRAATSDRATRDCRDSIGRRRRKRRKRKGAAHAWRRSARCAKRVEMQRKENADAVAPAIGAEGRGAWEGKGRRGRRRETPFARARARAAKGGGRREGEGKRRSARLGPGARASENEQRVG